MALSFGGLDQLRTLDARNAILDEAKTSAEGVDETAPLCAPKTALFAERHLKVSPDKSDGTEKAAGRSRHNPTKLSIQAIHVERST